MITRYVTLPLLRQSAHEMPIIPISPNLILTKKLSTLEFNAECRNEHIESLLFAITGNLDSSL